MYPTSIHHGPLAEAPPVPRRWGHWLWGLFLAMSLFSAHFQDPTLFHQASPVDGIHNWLGIVGALFAGTLLEWFGTSAFLLGWLLWRLPRSRKLLLEPRQYSFLHSRLILTILLVASTSMLHGMFGTARSLAINFHWQEGYLGQIGREWIVNSPIPWVSLTGVALVGLWCLMRLSPILFLPLPLGTWLESLPQRWSPRSQPSRLRRSNPVRQPRGPLFSRKSDAVTARLLRDVPADPIPESLKERA